jgi:hypothetical protein
LNLCWAGHPKSLLRAQQPRRPSDPTGLISPTAKPFHPRLFHCRAGPTRQSPFSPSLLPFLLRLYPAAGQPSRIAQGARDGTAAPARRPARRGIGRAHVRVEPGPDGKNPLLPPRCTSLCPSLCKGGSGAASVAWAVQAGAARGFRPTVAAPGFKSEGGRQRASRPSYQPHWGFPFPLHLRGRREREEKEAPPLRRAEEGRGHTGTPTTCQGRSAPPPPRRARRGRSRERGAGARTGAARDVRRREHLLHRERLHRSKHHRHATDDPKPATTTPPPHREHRPATLLSSPPWSSSCVGSVNVETRRC